MEHNSTVQDGAVPFATERRIHIALVVRDLARSRRFYEVLLAQEPTKLRPGYVKFEVAEPPVNLSLTEAPGAAIHQTGGHFGVQVKSSAAVRDATERFHAAGLALDVEEATSCCYALQSKVWVTDPDGHRWEVFVVLDADVPEPGETTRADAGSQVACCATLDARSVERSRANISEVCCATSPTGRASEACCVDDSER
jgi:catechol 2,3-dioxygenase-like lactoylglutathione lyase family enzyme